MYKRQEKDECLNYELIDGVVMMSPSPSREHQQVAGRLFASLFQQLSATPCEPLYELDVPFDGDVFKPDVMVFCDETAELPEIIMEILSPSTRHRDLRIKVVKYEEMGVKEYWIIDPKTRTITVHDFIGGTAEGYCAGETIQSQARPEIVIAVDDIFA